MKIISAPTEIRWLITNKCNLNCRHCLVSRLRNEAELAPEEIKAIIKQIIELKVFKVFISGGEPLLRNDFFSIIDALSKAKVKLSLFTNGTLITKDIAKRLAGYRIKSYHVSLESASAAVHDAIRGKGSFLKTIKGIKNLVVQGCPVTIAATMTHSNYRDAEKLILLGKRLRVRRVQLVELMYIGNASRNFKSLAMSSEERFELLSRVKELKIKYGDFLTGSISKRIRRSDILKLGAKLNFPLETGHCPAGNEQCAIRPDGWVTPCERLWFLKAGNLKKRSLSYIWRNSALMQLFRKGIIIKKEDVPECNKCKYLRPCYLIRRCKPFYYFRAKFGHKDLYCLDTAKAC